MIEGQSPHQQGTTNPARQTWWKTIGQPYCNTAAQRLGGSISVLADDPNKVMISCSIGAEGLTQ
jgi:hypothetical protein